MARTWNTHEPTLLLGRVNVLVSLATAVEERLAFAGVGVVEPLLLATLARSWVTWLLTAVRYVRVCGPKDRLIMPRLHRERTCTCTCSLLQLIVIGSRNALSPTHRGMTLFVDVRRNALHT